MGYRCKRSITHAPCRCPLSQREGRKVPSFFWQAYKAASTGHHANTMRLLCWWPLPLLLELLINLRGISRGFRQNGPWLSISDKNVEILKTICLLGLHIMHESSWICGSDCRSASLTLVSSTFRQKVCSGLSVASSCSNCAILPRQSTKPLAKKEYI